MSSPIRQPFRPLPNAGRRLVFNEENLDGHHEDKREEMAIPRPTFLHVEQNNSGKASPWVKSKREPQMMGRYPFESPSKSPGWLPYVGSNQKRGARHLTTLHSADQLRQPQKSYELNYGHASQFNTLAAPPNDAFDSRLRTDSLRRGNYLASPIKFSSPTKDNIFDSQLLGAHLAA